MYPQPQRAPWDRTLILLLLFFMELYIAPTLLCCRSTLPCLPTRLLNIHKYILYWNIFPSYMYLWGPVSSKIMTQQIHPRNFWAVTWISKICSAICTNWQHFINNPSATPSVRHLLLLQFLCHPVYTNLQYARWKSLSLCCTAHRTLFNTH